MNKINRSHFIKTMFTGAIALQLPFVFSCNTSNINGVTLIIEDKKYSINTIDLKLILDILMPETTVGPSAMALKADVYLFWLLADKKVDLSRKLNLATSIKRINDFSDEKYNSSLQELSVSKLQEVIKAVSNTTWGETNLSLLMTVCFEAMFANPIYNCNTDYIGWKWLEYTAGIPFPSIKNKYPEIMKINHLK